MICIPLSGRVSLSSELSEADEMFYELAAGSGGRKTRSDRMAAGVANRDGLINHCSGGIHGKVVLFLILKRITRTKPEMAAPSPL